MDCWNGLGLLRGTFGAFRDAVRTGAAVSRRADSYIEARLREQHGPGVALGVVHRGKLVKAAGYGLADVERGAPLTPDTVFEVGSLGKQITAVAVMMLAETGALKLEAPLPRFFPEAPAAWEQITVRDLLAHTSGLPEALDGAPGAEAPGGPRREMTEDEIVRAIAAQPLVFKPGQRFGYSPPGYLLLGALLRRVTGQSQASWLRQRIFDPLGMTSTRVLGEAEIFPGRASGYRLIGGDLKRARSSPTSLNTIQGGALCSTVLDLAKWDAALTTGALLREDTLRRMWTPARLADGESPYGLGFYVTRWNRRRLVKHVGTWHEYTGAMCRFIDDRLTVIVLSNLYERSLRHDVFALAVAALYIPDLARSIPRDAA